MINFFIGMTVIFKTFLWAIATSATLKNNPSNNIDDVVCAAVAPMGCAMRILPSIMGNCETVLLIPSLNEYDTP